MGRLCALAYRLRGVRKAAQAMCSDATIGTTATQSAVLESRLHLDANLLPHLKTAVLPKLRDALEVQLRSHSGASHAFT